MTDNKNTHEKNMERRSLLKGLAVVPAIAGTIGAANAQSAVTLTPLQQLSEVPIDQSVDRPWLGEQFWANSLQHWELRDGRLTCISGRADGAGQSVSLLTRELNRNDGSAIIRASFFLRPGSAGSGFTGFLVGVGRGDLDYRASALGQGAGGEGGGIVASMTASGRLQFLDHSNEDSTRTLLPFTDQDRGEIGRPSGRVNLELRIEPQSERVFRLLLIAADNKGRVIGTARLNNVPASRVVGGISLINNPEEDSGGRWSISRIATGGPKITETPSNTLGTVIGTMHSLSKGVLRMTAQFMPITPLDAPDRGAATFQFRRVGNRNWRNGPTVDISGAYVATFRMEGWNSSRDYEYRIVFAGTRGTLYRGRIRREPDSGAELSIGLFSCVLNSGRGLTGNPPMQAHVDEVPAGKYTTNNFYFPHTELTDSATDKDPDILVFCGDQYYEGSPVRIDLSTPENTLLSTLYRWYLWYWSFRDLARDRPTIVLADDHDVLQGNLWGQNGRRAPGGRDFNGGYTRDISVVRKIYEMQCGHNPDPFDPEPIQNDIPVYYSAFVYGGVSFALIEDRKFKQGPDSVPNLDPADGILLGTRQIQFLSEWAEIDPDLPKIVLSQSPWATLQSTAQGNPRGSRDSNGFYTEARDRALRRVKEAGAIMLAGDQHLATLVRHGINRFDDGPVQFAGPAGAALFMRWLEQREPLANQRNNDINTGDFTDFYDNQVRLLAVANPQITRAEFEAGITSSRVRQLYDRRLKSEGYGVVKVNKQSEQFTFECWASNGSVGLNDTQYPGWPFVLDFDDV